MRTLWTWVLLALESVFYWINRGLWLAVYPFRRFTARHHNTMADWFETQAHRAQAEGRYEVAAELRELARLRRKNARRLQ